MITAFTGLPGAGKTLRMIKEMHKERFWAKIYRYSEDLVQITNFPVNKEMFPNTIVIGNDEIRKLYDWILKKEHYGASIYLDEASILFPSMDYKNIPKDVIIALRQHRHAGYNLYYTAQNLDDVAKGLRTVTQFVYEINGWSALRFSTYSCYSVRAGKANYKDKYDRGILLHTKKLYNSYNTENNIDTPDYLKLGTPIEDEPQ